MPRLLGYRLHADDLRQVVSQRQTDHALMCTNHTTRLLRHLLQHPVNRLVPCDRLCRISGSLEGEELVLHVRLRLDPVGDV